MLIKICGLTNFNDALLARGLGADLLGFVFFKNSPRYILLENAQKIISKIRENERRFQPLCVGVFVNENEDTVIKFVKECRLDIVQLHGEESPEYCKSIKAAIDIKIIKAIKIKDTDSLTQFDLFADIPDYFLCDTYSEEQEGGTGKTFNHLMIKEYIPKYKIFLAGGLHPDNIKNILETIRPYGVDVSSGVEVSAGKKDIAKMKNFIKNVRENEQSK